MRKREPLENLTMPYFTKSLPARFNRKLRASPLRDPSQRTDRPAPAIRGAKSTKEETSEAAIVETSFSHPSPDVDWIQSQSAFFRLPAEIRNQIYHEFWQYDVAYHIVFWESGLGHYCCSGAKTNTFDFEAPCWGHVWGDDLPNAPTRREAHKSALLRTCKRL